MKAAFPSMNRPLWRAVPRMRDRSRIAAHPGNAPFRAGADGAAPSLAGSWPQRVSRFGKASFSNLLAPALVLASVALVGCRVGPAYRPPSAATPAAYAGPVPLPSPTPPPPAASLAEWWRVFQDAELDALVREAADANLDVRIARARVREARALRGVTRSAQFPEVDAGAGYQRARRSENTEAGRRAIDAAGSIEGDFFDAALDMRWEIDVFGGRRRAVEAAQADLEATDEARRETLVTVLAEVGLNYLELRGAERQLAVARGNLHAQEQTLVLTRDRARAGLASDLDTARAEAQVAATEAQIPPLEEAKARARHRLGVLLGRTPTDLDGRLADGTTVPSGVPGVPVGLPSDLLLRRPDLRRAERLLAAATARVGVATAELFPRFFLTGAAGLQSVEATDWIDGGSRFWSLGPTMRWPIFDAGRIRQQIRAENAREEQALLQYQSATLTALEEVENALVSFGQEQERRRALAASETATRRAAALAHERYRGGLVDFLDVLEAERSLLAVQDSLVRSERTLGQNLIRLYKALGGGWQLNDGNAARDTASAAGTQRNS